MLTNISRCSSEFFFPFYPENKSTDGKSRFLHKKRPESKFRSECLNSLFEIELFFEFFDTAAAVDKLLLPCEERMACRAYVKTHLFFHGLCLKRIPAGAGYFADLVIRMDSFSHVFHLFSRGVYVNFTFFYLSSVFDMRRRRCSGDSLTSITLSKEKSK